MNNDTWQHIKILGMNVDGVLTDGNVYCNEKGSELLSFNRYDSFGMHKLMSKGIHICILSYHTSATADKYLREIGVKDIYFDVKMKINALQQVAAKYDCGLVDIAYIGTDEFDLEIFNHIGLPIAVANAQRTVIDSSKYVTTRTGGNGAVREVCDLLIEAKLQKEISESYEKE